MFPKVTPIGGAAYYPSDKMEQPTPTCDGRHSLNHDIGTKQLKELHLVHIDKSKEWAIKEPADWESTSPWHMTQ